MTYLEEIASDQLDSIDKSTEQHSLLTSFEGFLELLIDLNIVSTSNSSSDLVRYSDDQLVELEGFENSFEPKSIEAEAKPLTCELISSQQQLKLEDALETWAVLDTPETAQVRVASFKIKPKPFLLPGSKETFEQNDTGIEKKSQETKTEDPLELLQNLLSDPQVAKCRHSVIGLEQKVAKLESEIYQPEQLIDLLLPVISELLRRKVVSSHSKEIAPEMGIAIKQQITLRDAMVDALYPVIGSTIAKYMAEAIRSINEKIENSLSPLGIIRKFRAKLQGVSEAELILKEAMPFSVQAIFLIHKSSGLVIGEVQSGSQQLESDMVAGMLTAIRSFVNDCIAHTGDSEVHTIEYGNSKIILEVAGYCYLAAVIDGEPPQWFIGKMRQTLAAIVQNYGESVETFEGDSTTIPEQINSLLEQLKHTSSNTKSNFTPVIIGSILSLILLPWGFFQYRHLIDSRIQTDTAFALASTPELAVYRLTVNVNQANMKLSGMLPNQYLPQKAEQIAKQVAPNLKLDNQILAVDVPPDPVLATAEVKLVTSILNQMDGIAIKANYAERLVTLEGTVNDFTDAEKITDAFKQIPGVNSVTNTVEIKSLPSTIRLYFDRGSTELKSADIVKIILLKQFLNRYPEKHLKIIGHSASNGNILVNQQLALQRALSVQNALISQGIDSKRMQTVGMTTPHADYHQPPWLSRYVYFKFITPSISK